MNEINNGLITGINTLIDKAITELKLDKTITASIKSIVDVVNGEYKVSYEGNVFSAFALNGQEYEVDDSVYVKIPENDWNNKKYISGIVAHKSIDSSSITALDNEYIEVGPTWDTLFNYDPANNEDGYGVCSGIDHDEYVIYENDSGYSSEEFSLYHKEYEYVRISAEFLTLFKNKPNAGRYGLRLKFKTKNDGETVSFDFDST